MLRLYLSKDVRMHVWHPDFAVKDVSTIHTHPWDFTSHVIAGSVTNHKYQLRETAAVHTHLGQTIRCGEGGGMCGSPKRCYLYSEIPQQIGEGERYDEQAEEIHETRPEAGTVTIVERRFKADTEHASVFYPVGKQWVSAEPRPATPEEVIAITQIALRRWF